MISVRATALCARRRLVKAVVGQQVRASDDLGDRRKHLGIVGRDDQVDAVVRAFAGAADQVGVAAGRRFVAGAAERLAGGEGAGEFDTGQVQHRLLHRHLDELALAGPPTLYQRCQDGDREVHPGAAVADIGAVDQRRAVGLPGDAHCAGGRLGDRLEAFEPAIGPVGAKTLDRGIAEQWNRLGTRLIPKLRAAGTLTAAIRLETEVDPPRAAALATELQQIIDEIGLSGAVRVEREPQP
jgi:hypothetical protein